MAVRNNGLEEGPVKFTDNRPGRQVFVGPTTPGNPVDGDIWVDSDLLNNSGKNLISSITLNADSSKDISISSDYKDLYVVFRGVTTSTDATVNFTLNNNSTNYATGSTLFSITSYKGSTTTNHFIIEVLDTQDTASFAWASLKGVYTNVANTPTILDSVNAFTQTAALTTLKIQPSAGTLASGTILVYGVN